MLCHDARVGARYQLLENGQEQSILMAHEPMTPPSIPLTRLIIDHILTSIIQRLDSVRLLLIRESV